MWWVCARYVLPVVPAGRPLEHYRRLYWQGADAAAGGASAVSRVSPTLSEVWVRLLLQVVRTDMVLHGAHINALMTVA